MSDWTPELAAQIQQRVQQDTQELVQAFSRAWDRTFTQATAGEPVTVADIQQQLQGPGLALFFQVGEQGALALVPEASGLLPSWYRQPDATGTSKLQTLAQEAGMILLPDELMPLGAEVADLEPLAEALRRWSVEEQATVLPLELAGEEGSGTLWLCWPAKAAAAQGQEEKKPSGEEKSPQPQSASPKEKPAATASSGKASAGGASPGRRVRSLEELPPYIRSLLKVRLPVMVTLASRKMKVKEILELVPGAIIQFDKSCEDLLDLEVAGVRIAVGEAVKVGEKFGLRIRRMVPPEERYLPLKPKRRPA